MKQFKNTEEIKPDNILIKASWNNQLEFLSLEERGIVFTNIFNYHLERQLEEMTIPAKMFFMNAVEVFVYNTEKYKNKIERNREVGKLGGRPKKQINNQLVIPETQNNPKGFIQNTDNPKDIDIDKVIDKVIDKDKTRDIVTDITRIKEIDKTKKTGFQKLVRISIDSLEDAEDIQVIRYIKILVEKIGFDQFINLVLGSSNSELEHLISSLNLGEYELALKDIRRNHIFYLQKFNGN